jgi:hypothetical protein
MASSSHDIINIKSCNIIQEESLNVSEHLPITLTLQLLCYRHYSDMDTHSGTIVSFM